MKKTAKKIISLVLVFAMLFSLTSTAMAGYVKSDYKDGYYYVALGDSVASGFGMTDREDYDTMDGFNAWDSYRPSDTVPESYPAVFAAQLLAELRDEEIIDEMSDFNWANLGVASFQTYDYYRSILDGSWTGTFWANMTGGYSADAVAQRERAAAQAQAYRDNPDQFWNEKPMWDRNTNGQKAIDYVIHYYDAYQNSTGKNLLYTTFGIEFEYGKEPWFEEVKGLSGTDRQTALRTWANTYAKEALLPAMVDNAAKNAVNGSGWQQPSYLYHDLFVEKLKNADMITLHIGANDLLEQFMFDLISMSLVGRPDNPEAESFGASIDTDYLAYKLTDTDGDGVYDTCDLYNPVMYMLWCTLFTLMEGIDEAAVAAQLITMINNYQAVITDEMLIEAMEYIESSTLEEHLYQNGVEAMRYYEPIVKMIKEGGDFELDLYGKTTELSDDPYVTAEEYVEELGEFTNDVEKAAKTVEGQPVKNDAGWKHIKALNEDAQIVFIGTFNPFGTNLEYNGESYNFGNIVCNVLTDIFCGLKTGELNGTSILTGIGEVVGFIGLEEGDALEAAVAKLAQALAKSAEAPCTPCCLEDDAWISIFGEVTKDAELENVFAPVFYNNIEIPEESTVVVNAATYELDGTATPGGATVVPGEGILTIIPDGAKFPLLGTAIVNGAPVQLTPVPVGFKLEDGVPTGEMITYEAFVAKNGTQPDQWSRNYDSWMAKYNAYAWTNIYTIPVDPEVPMQIDLIMRSAVTNEQFIEFVNTDAGKHSLLDLITALTLAVGEGATVSFADLASEQTITLFKGIYGAVDLKLPSTDIWAAYEDMGTRSYLGLGELEDMLSMDLIFAVLLMQAGMDADAALESAQLLNTVFTDVHYPVMYTLMGKPGLKACDYLNDWISDVAEKYDSPFVYILDMPNENDFNPHPSIENAAWLANRIFETIVMRVTVEGAGGEGHGMVYGPNSKRANNAYDVLYGFDATFDAVPDYAYKLDEYSVDGAESARNRNQITIKEIKNDVTLSVEFGEGEDPYSIGAPDLFGPEHPEGLVGVDTTAPDAKDGLILNTTTKMQWTDNLEEPNWQLCGDGAVSNLAAGTYYVRYLHGTAYAVVVIEEGQGGADVTPTQVFGIATSKSGESDGAISRTTQQMEYTAKENEDGTPDFSEPITCGNGATRGLPAGNYYVRYIGGISYVKVNIPDGTGEPDIAPDVSAKNTSGKGKQDGKIMGTTVEMQYSKDSSFPSRQTITCNEGSTDNLAAGTYYVRYIGGKNYTAVEIKEGSSSGDGGERVVYVSGGTTVVTVKEEKCPRDETCPIDEYRDTLNDFWWHDGIHYCLENGYMNGIAEGLFDPDGFTDRAMIVAVLWRLEGCPVVNYKMSFADVPDTWFTEAVRWAQSCGIVTGYSDEAFGPYDLVTREQLAAIMWRYANYKGYKLEKTSALANYTDASSVSDWALTSVKWANGAGIIQGRTSSMIVPRGDATRAEVANIIMRFCESVDE